MANISVYFYCCPSASPECQPYQHALVCLAEGLRELGISFYSDRDYWRLSPDTNDCLFVHHPDVTPEDCSVVILDGEWFTEGRPVPDGLFKPDRSYVTAYFELSELMHSVRPEFQRFDFVFRGAYNTRFAYAANVHPWAYALTERILRENAQRNEFSHRKKHLLSNFRHTQPMHSVRKYAAREFIPALAKVMAVDETTEAATAAPSDPYHFMQWDQTGRRHYPAYYHRLNESMACACFGGFFTSPWPRNQRAVLSIVIKRLLSRLGRKTNTIQQWDSWRLWEAFAAGCAVFHVDFEKYGFALPVMPENWRHYIGVDLDNLEAAIESIAADPESLERIAAAGREWALDNYSPVAVAERFLKTTLSLDSAQE